MVRVFHTLEPEFRDKWVVDSRQTGIIPFDTKKKAVKKGREIAKRNRPTELEILCKDGSLDKKQRYD